MSRAGGLDPHERQALRAALPCVVSRRLLLHAGLVAAGSWCVGGCHAPPPRADAAASRGPAPSLFAHRWQWTDEAGQSLSFARWQGSQIVLTGIYTTCMRTCPLTIQKLRAVYRRFEAAGRRAQFVLVTFDPEVDTPPRLREFKASRKLPEAWHSRRGKRATRELTNLLGIHLLDMDTHIFHDSRIALVDERGLVVRSLACCQFDDSALL